MSQTQSPLTQPRTSIPRTGVSRPAWSVTRQEVILARDASGSMAGQKATDCSAASLDLVTELASPANQDAFDVGIVDFSDHSSIVQPLARATQLTRRTPPLDLGNGFGGYTNITASLEDADRMLRDAAKNRNDGCSYSRPVVVVMSDGAHNSGPEPYPVAERVKKIADFVAIAFGNDADEASLCRLASAPHLFCRCKNGSELRRFFQKIGTSMAVSRKNNTSFTTVMGQQ